MKEEKMYITESINEYFKRGGNITKCKMKSCCYQKLYGSMEDVNEECLDKVIKVNVDMRAKSTI